MSKLQPWKIRFGIIGIMGLAAFVLMLVPATPARAYDDIIIEFDGGMMQFHDQGDVFTVCDTVRDYLGVVGKVYYKPLFGDWAVTAVLEDGGDPGCAKRGINVNNVGDYQMRLYQSGQEMARSRVFNE